MRRRCLGVRTGGPGTFLRPEVCLMKILIAADQPPAALFLRRTLEKMGHEAIVAVDGEAAWWMIRRGDAPVLISDWMMPHLDGLELCRRLRTTRSDRYIYIILLTSRDRQNDKLEGLRAGEVNRMM